ncbi:MAG TPA: isoprenylcysteine carboxylmethyltransferase family protein [Methylocella sp.]|jgi:protein-S-isoprenylcysteine O-methyltransferase Ste14
MQHDPTDKAKVTALPPLILAGFLALGFVLDRMRPVTFLPRTLALVIGILVTLCGISLGLLAVRDMVRAKTALDPRKPTTEIVTSGVFQFSRNPIYFGMVLLCLGAGFLLDSLWFLALCVPLAVVLQKGVIEPEEAYLERKFGGKYLRYKTKVRRWL